MRKGETTHGDREWEGPEGSTYLALDDFTNSGDTLHAIETVLGRDEAAATYLGVALFRDEEVRLRWRERYPGAGYAAYRDVSFYFDSNYLQKVTTFLQTVHVEPRRGLVGVGNKSASSVYEHPKGLTELARAW